MKPAPDHAAAADAIVRATAAATEPGFTMQLVASLAQMQPTATDRVTLARVQIKTAIEAARAGDMGAVVMLLDDALGYLRGGE
jgi:hypothetical protein